MQSKQISKAEGMCLCLVLCICKIIVPVLLNPDYLVEQLSSSLTEDSIRSQY